LEGDLNRRSEYLWGQLSLELILDWIRGVKYRDAGQGEGVVVEVGWKGLEGKKIVGGGGGGRGKGLQGEERKGRRAKEERKLMVGLVGWRRLSGAGCGLELELLYYDTS